MQWGTQRGLVVVDVCPQVGNFLEGLMTLQQSMNNVMVYAPIFHHAAEQEWFQTYWLGEVAQAFQRGEVKLPNLERPGLNK